MASAVDSRRPTASPPANSAKPRSTGKNPVAQEIAVVATGARPGHGQRELFTEETSTVLVFEDGAVIRLSAAVASGQLVFLTNKESRREVVAQVARKREYRPTSSNVEVEYSEPAPGFWGIDFSQEGEQVPFNDQQQAAAELVQASRTVSDKSNKPAPPPSSEDVDGLKKEVEALRKQLQSLKTQTVEPKEIGQKAPAPPTPSHVISPPASAALRVNRAMSPLPAARKSKVAARGSFRPGVVRIAVLSAALLVVVLSASIYLHWIPLPDLAKSLVPGPTAASSGKPVSLAAPAGAPHSSQPVVSTSTQTASTVSGSLQPPTLATSRPAGSAPVYASEASDSDIKVIEVVPGSEVTSEPAVEKRAVPYSRAHTARASSGPMAVAGGGPITPPKLLKSFRAIASPSNLEYFDKSNTVTVVLDGIVDTSGHVNSMSVVSGPLSLRAAAMSALALYEYTPARQNGRAVAAHVTVTIKFLFEP